MKQLIIPALLFTLSFSAIADVSLPRIDAPEELVAGDFEEGTITQISEAEIAEFLPWAQNAQNQLTRAMNTARSMPLRDRLSHIERAVKSVVNRSGSRQYQMFMRFSLNRGLLLVSEMNNTMDMNSIGAQENALDLLQRSINVGLSFYESDLSFQQRSQGGHTATSLAYARFGANFMNEVYQGVLNVLDASAQYRLLYKLVEMVNWDLSRDEHASRYAEVIVEAYELLQALPADALDQDRSNLRNVRLLNSLRILSVKNLHVEVTRSIESTREQQEIEDRNRRLQQEIEARNRRLGAAFTAGSDVLWVPSNNIPLLATIVTRQENNLFTIRANNRLHVNIEPTRLGRQGCVGEICTDASRVAWNVTSDNKVREVNVVGIHDEASFILYFPESIYNLSSLTGKYGGSWNVSRIARAQGCHDGLCVGEKVINLQRSTEVEVVGIMSDGKYIIKFLSGELRGKLGPNWRRESLSKLQ